MPSTRKQTLKKSKAEKRDARLRLRRGWIIFLVLALNALAIPTHLLGISIHTGDAEHRSGECPMHQNTAGDSGEDDSCVCSGGLCSFGGTNNYLHVGPGLFECNLQYTGGNFSWTFAQNAGRDNYSIYQSRAPPLISLS